MKMESQIYLRLVDAVTKYFGKLLSHRQMMTSPKWLRPHLVMIFVDIFLSPISNIYFPLIRVQELLAKIF